MIICRGVCETSVVCLVDYLTEFFSRLFHIALVLLLGFMPLYCMTDGYDANKAPDIG